MEPLWSKAGRTGGALLEQKRLQVELRAPILVGRGPAQCWRPPWGRRDWRAAEAGGVRAAKHGVSLQYTDSIRKVCSAPESPQQLSTSPQQSNAISQSRNSEFPESRAGEWSCPFHGCISGGPGHCQAGDLAETSSSFPLHPSIFLCQKDPSARRSHPGRCLHKELNLRGL